MKIRNIIVGFSLISAFILGGCSTNNKESDQSNNATGNNEESKANEGFGEYKGLKVGDTVSMETIDVGITYDFTLNSVAFTDQPLNGKSPGYGNNF